MLTYIIRRLLYSIVVLILASFLVFTFVSVSGDPLAPLRITPNVSEQTVQNIVERKHLDRSIPVRYAYWVNDAFTNQFGTTLLTDKPILPDLVRVLKNTMQLVIAAELLAILLAVTIGVYSALRQYSVFDYTATTFSFLGLATPLFWLALMLQVLVVQIFLWTGHRIFPIANLSSVDPGTGINFVIDRAHHLVLPVLVLMVLNLAAYTRYMRASMLEVINSDYVRTARAKGLPERRVTMKHAFRNALVPLVTLVALNFGGLLGGAIVTETVFSLDGMGLYFISALGTSDPYPVMAWLMVTATMIIIFNLVADIAYGYLDPRVRYD
ncbi:MAG TPA: ABC transporter permease [Gaiellaceae bacterium]|nr:ABC transporter permease [Gaiellaceae bacterium]